jgi:hypothetical protein
MIRSLGLTHLKIFLHIGSKIIAPSTERQRPAPRDSHTEKVKVFRPFSLMSSACLILSDVS